MLINILQQRQQQERLCVCVTLICDTLVTQTSLHTRTHTVVLICVTRWCVFVACMCVWGMSYIYIYYGYDHTVSCRLVVS